MENEAQQDDVKFVEGMRFEKPRENAPEFVKGKISIRVDEFINYLKGNKNENGWVNIDLLKSKKGNLYLKLNDWNKDTEESTQEDSFDL